MVFPAAPGFDSESDEEQAVRNPVGVAVSSRILVWISLGEFLPMSCLSFGIGRFVSNGIIGFKWFSMSCTPVSCSDNLFRLSRPRTRQPKSERRLKFGLCSVGKELWRVLRYRSSLKPRTE